MTQPHATALAPSLTSSSAGRIILRSNAAYLLFASTAALLLGDLPGIFLGRGPVDIIVRAAPHAGIGLVEAHGLAFILGVLFWRAMPARSWFLTAMSVELLLGSCNLVFWSLFEDTGMVAQGVVLTACHWLFAALQLYAAITSPPSARHERAS